MLLLGFWALDSSKYLPSFTIIIFITLVQGSDFQPLTTSLTFTHPTSTTGSITLQECIMFNIVNDIFAENPESFTVTVILTEAGASSPVNSASGSVTITDDDSKKTCMCMQTESSNLIGSLPCNNSWYSTPIITPLRVHAVNWRSWQLIN